MINGPMSNVKAPARLADPRSARSSCRVRVLLHDGDLQAPTAVRQPPPGPQARRRRPPRLFLVLSHEIKRFLCVSETPSLSAKFSGTPGDQRGQPTCLIDGRVGRRSEEPARPPRPRAASSRATLAACTPTGCHARRSRLRGEPEDHRVADGDKTRTQPLCGGARTSRRSFHPRVDRACQMLCFAVKFVTTVTANACSRRQPPRPPARDRSDLLHERALAGQSDDRGRPDHRARRWLQEPESLARVDRRTAKLIAPLGGSDVNELPWDCRATTRVKRTARRSCDPPMPTGPCTSAPIHRHRKPDRRARALGPHPQAFTPSRSRTVQRRRQQSSAVARAIRARPC